MSVVIVNGPLQGAYYTKAQLPAFKVHCKGSLDVLVRLNTTPYFSASYVPDFSDYVYFDIKDIIKASLLAKFSNNQDYFEQTNFNISLNVFLTDSENTISVAFNVMNINANIKSFCAITENFLTFQPSVKKITVNTPEYLTYFFTQKGQMMKAKIYRKNGTTETITLRWFGQTNNRCLTQDVSFKYIAEHSNSWISSMKPFYDVYVVDPQGNIISNVQRYQVVDETDREKYYLFANALGGIDTLTCIGQSVQSPEIEYNIGELADKLVQLDDSEDRVNYKQNSGYLSSKYKKWVLDFLMTKGLKCIYDQETGNYKNIVIKEQDSQINDHDGFTSFDFTYRMVDGDIMDFEPKPLGAEKLAVTSRMDETIEFESPSRTIEVDYNKSQDSSNTGSIECTSSSGLMLQIGANGYVSVYTSADNETWSLVETVLVNGSIIRLYDYAVQGSYWKVEATCKITMIKILT